MRQLFLFMLAGLLFLAPLLHADQFGDVVFQRPEGWTSVQQGDSMLLVPGDVPKSYVLTLAVRKGEPLNGRTQRQFLEDVLKAGMTEGTSVVSSAPVQGSLLPSGRTVLTTTRVMSTKEGATFLVQYFALQSGTSGYSVSLISNSEDLVKKYSETIGRFVASLQFAAQPQ